MAAPCRLSQAMTPALDLALSCSAAAVGAYERYLRLRRRAFARSMACTGSSQPHHQARIVYGTGFTRRRHQYWKGQDKCFLDA